jgi:CheY-like chemotaxis protein
MMTAYVMDQAVAEAVHEGVVTLVGKPFTADHLLTVIRAALTGRSTDAPTPG